MNVANTARLLGVSLHGQAICTALLMILCALLALHLATALRHANKTKAMQEADTGEQDSCPPQPNMEALPEAPAIETAYSDASRIVYGSYDRSFRARLLLADGTLKTRYAALANQLLGYRNVRCRISWAYASFTCGRRTVAKIAIKGKTLCLHLPLDPAAYVNTKYNAIDVSTIKKYAAVPTCLKVRSPRAFKYAQALIARTADGMVLLRGKEGGLTAADFPFTPFSTLLARGLIRLRTKGGAPLEEGDTLVWAGFERRERIPAVEVKAVAEERIALPEGAMPPPQQGAPRKRARRMGRKYIVNLDALSAVFSAGERADLTSMRERRLLPAKATAVKVLARGILNKPLTVIADDYSADAITMILLAGGEALFPAISES